MSMSNLFNNRPHHHKDTTLLDRVVKQIHIDLDNGDFDPIYVLLDYLSEEVLKAYLPEENDMKFSAKTAVKEIVYAASGDGDLYDAMVRHDAGHIFRYDDLLNIENAIRTAYEKGVQDAQDGRMI